MDGGQEIVDVVKSESEVAEINRISALLNQLNWAKNCFFLYLPSVIT